MRAFCGPMNHHACRMLVSELEHSKKNPAECGGVNREETVTRRAHNQQGFRALRRSSPVEMVASFRDPPTALLMLPLVVPLEHRFHHQIFLMPRKRWWNCLQIWQLQHTVHLPWRLPRCSARFGRHTSARQAPVGTEFLSAQDTELVVPQRRRL